MRALSAAELLSVWERGQSQPPVEKALALLTFACDGTPPEELALWSIGRRDDHLLTLREWAFGPRLQSIADCPACAARLELEFGVADIRVVPADSAVKELTLSVAGHEIHFRLPNSADLAGLSATEDTAANQLRLIERCVLSARRDEREVRADDLPAQVVSALAQRMAEADPQADVQLTLRCPACRHAWKAAFDIVSFFWSEISAWATRLLREIHLLASAYGWSEAEILALSPRRRQAYLEMAGA